MKLMFVRHAEPDYKHDSLTLKGHREAQLLSLRLAKLDVRDFYASPLGRAQETARYTLERTHRTAERCRGWRSSADGALTRRRAQSGFRGTTSHGCGRGILCCTT